MLTIHSLVARISRGRSAAVALAALLCGGVAMMSSSARAAIITSGPYTATGTAGNATATVISAFPTFDITSAAKSFTSIGPLDYSFPATNNGATVTYLVSEGITNNTNQTWTDYHEQLGTGTDGQFVVGDAVKFVTPADSTYTNPSFPTRTVTGNDLTYTGGSVAPGQAISITFSITVPDVAGAAGPVNFTLRQFPTVPEPATFGLLAVGAIGLLGRRRRHG